MKFPWRNLLLGDLVQHSLIQMQHIKYQNSQMKFELQELKHRNDYFWMVAWKVIPTCFLAYGVFTTFPWMLRAAMSWNPLSQSKKDEHPVKMRQWLRELHSIAVKYIGQQYIGDSDYGVVLEIVRDMSAWNAKKKAVRNEEDEWLQFDLNHLISQQFTVQQNMALVQRLERYYL